MQVLCGVDIIEIDRVRKSFETSGDAFRNRVFTRREIELCESRKASRFMSYAARFAAKEAVSKAFGTGIGKLAGLHDIEVLNDDSGKPCVNLYDKALELYGKLGGVSISVSLSHCDCHAVACATLLVM